MKQAFEQYRAEKAKQYEKEWKEELVKERNAGLLANAYVEQFDMQIGQRGLKRHKINLKKNSSLGCFAYTFYHNERVPMNMEQKLNQLMLRNEKYFESKYPHER